MFVQGFLTDVEHNFDVARRCGHPLVMPKWVIDVAGRCRHLLITPKWITVGRGQVRGRGVGGNMPRRGSPTLL